MDKRAKGKYCGRCNPKFNSPRLGTGQGWVLHSTGYMTSFINGKWVYQHRYLMEKYLERKLKKSEHVHHINGIKTDNRIENLQILTSYDHHRLHIEPIKYNMSKLGHKKRWGYVSFV